MQLITNKPHLNPSMIKFSATVLLIQTLSVVEGAGGEFISVRKSLIFLDNFGIERKIT